MNKRPWYIWLSVIAFALLWSDTTRRITFAAKSKFENGYDKTNIWISALGQMFLSLVVFLMIPMIPFLIVLDRMDTNNVVYTIVNCVQILVLYALGVVISYRHVLWRQRRISFLLDSK